VDYEHPPTRDTFSCTKENDGGWTIVLSIKKTSLARLTTNHREKLQELAAILLSMRDEFDTESAGIAGIRPD